MSRTIEYNSNFFIQYFVDPPLALITSKIRRGIQSTGQQVSEVEPEVFSPCVYDCVFRNC